MLHKQRFFMLILTALMLVMFISQSAFALKVTVSNSSHTTTEGYNGSLDGEHETMRSYAMYMDANENFSITFTATDVVGTLSWHYSGYNDETIELFEGKVSADEGVKSISDVQFSYSGNTATLTGKLHQDSARLTISVIADDLEYSTAYSHMFIEHIFILNKSYFNTDENRVVPAPTNPEEGAVNTQPQKTEELHVGIIEAVQLDDDVMQKLADNAGIDKSELHLLTNEDFTTTTPPEPTQSMRDQVASDGYEFAAKLNTINVKEDGYYVFKVTVSDDLVGVNVSDLKLYYAEDSDFITSAINSVKLAFGLMPIINGVTGGLEVSNFLGVKLDTLPKQFLATMFLSASKSITVYIVRILLLLLGGCNSGFGMIGGGVVALISCFIAVKVFKKNKKGLSQK